MSDHRLDTLATDPSGSPRCSLDHAQKARQHYGRHARPPSAPDERGAVAVVDLLGCGDPSHAVCGGRMAFFRVAGVEQCQVIFLDRAQQPHAHAPGADHPRAAAALQSASRAQSQPGDAGPLFGTPGCAAPACEPAPVGSQVHVPAPTRVALVCSKCGKPPSPDSIAILGSTHYLVRHRNDASRPRVDFTRWQRCGKWVKAP